MRSSTSNFELATPSEPRRQGQWAIVAGIAFLIICVAYLAFAVRINALPNTPDVSNDEYVHARALRYHFEQNRIVIIGSSLAYNLREVYFKEDVANLAFPGGVAVTGAELVRWSDIQFKTDGRGSGGHQC